MFKNLKSLFIIEEDEPKQKSVPKSKPTPKSNKGNQIVKESSVPTTQPIAPVKGKANEKFMNILLAAMEKNNLEGLDYLEFKQSLQALDKMPMDEATKFKSAFAMASSMGVTPNKLIQTAQHYINVLTQEDKKFGQALKQQQQVKIGQQQGEIQTMEKAIKEKADMIKKLTQDIDKMQKQVSSKKKLISEASSKINQTKGDFEASFALLTNQIKADIDNMKKYLGGPKAE